MDFNLSSKNLLLIVIVVLILFIYLKERKKEKFDFYTMDEEKNDLKMYNYYDITKPVEGSNNINDHNHNLNYLIINESCST